MEFSINDKVSLPITFLLLLLG